MLHLQYPGRWKLAGVFLPLIVLGAALAPAFWALPDDSGPDWIELDKLLHGITFAVLALWYTGQYARGSYWLIALGLIVYGALIEVFQSWLPYRTAESGDMTADVVGIVFGMTIAFVATGGWSLRAEEWLINRFG